MPVEVSAGIPHRGRGVIWSSCVTDPVLHDFSMTASFAVALVLGGQQVCGDVDMAHVLEQFLDHVQNDRAGRP